MRRVIGLCVVAVCFGFLPRPVSAESAVAWLGRQELSFRLQGSFNIGGTSPVPIPPQIRRINGYDSGLTMGFEALIHKKLPYGFGLLSGIRLENKGMETDAQVKNYKMAMTADDGSSVRGYWTGNVVTDVNSSWVTLPLLATYKPIDRLELQLGFFFSWLIKGHFGGYVYEGYLRENDPTGEKIVFTDGARAAYEFTDELRRFQWGLETGVSWRVWGNLSVRAGLTWGFRSIFGPEFETITFGMYPVYAQVGFTYTFS